MAVPLKVVNDMPAEELADKIVLDTNNYMVWRDGHIPVIDLGDKTVHELRQEHLPRSKVVKAFTHIQAPRITTTGQAAGTHDMIMGVFGGLSKGERNRIKIRVRAAMAAITATEERFLGGRPPYGCSLQDAGPHPHPHPNPGKAAVAAAGG